MTLFRFASRDNSHNILPAWLRMSVKSLWYNAPGETRTPNLLIRSQSLPLRQSGSTAGIGTVAATQIPKADTTSQNIRHNSLDLWRLFFGLTRSDEILYSGSRPLALCGWWTA